MENVIEKEGSPKFTFSYWMAIILELAIFMCMIKGWAIIGIILMTLYFRFTATFAALFDKIA